MSYTVPSSSVPAGVRRVLAIAGSDSGGGAGIQADLKAFARCGVHGMTAVTAVTWQNTVAVTGVTPIPAEAILGQVRAVVEDIGVNAVKIGMLGSAEAVRAVNLALDLVPGVPIVIDPVMIAESGAHLLEPDARHALVDLLARATVATPNLHEARALALTAGLGPAGSQEELARAVHSLGCEVAVVTGGHGAGDTVIDLFFDGQRAVPIGGPRQRGDATHGSGCTHSSAMAAHLALGRDPLAAAREAQRLAAQAVADGLREIGHGPGPVDVFGLSARGGR